MNRGVVWTGLGELRFMVAGEKLEAGWSSILPGSATDGFTAAQRWTTTRSKARIDSRRVDLRWRERWSSLSSGLMWARRTMALQGCGGLRA
jgi:hypothetical protein